jgi:hypothetical protein
MTIRYKLTTQDMKTRAGFPQEIRWEIGKWVEATGNMQQPLCTDAWIHWYDHPLLAVLLNSRHADIDDPRLWEIETDGEECLDGQFKGGSRRVRLMKELPLPVVTTNELIRWAILCVKQVHHGEKWNAWADDWLSGTKRRLPAADEIRDIGPASAAFTVCYAVYAADASTIASACADAAYNAACVTRTSDRRDLDLVALVERAIREERAMLPRKENP